MKRIFILLSIVSIFASCDVLDVEPTNSIPASEAFKTKADVTRGILGAYNSLQSLSYYGRAYLTVSDLAADNLLYPPSATTADYLDIDNDHILPENGVIEGLWGAAYDGLNVANNVIAKIPELNFLSQDEKNSALAELYFLRALNHFNLMNYFGGIPLKTKPTIGLSEVNAARNTPDEVFASIIQDLTFASSYLPKSSSSKIRASQGAANALLARVYLYKKDYNNAVVYASKVIDDHSYTLLPNYADIFASDESGESIFEVDFTPLDRNRIAEYNFPLSLNGRGSVGPDPNIVNAYEANDKRKDVSIAYAGTVPYANKYHDLATGADNVIVLRLAEMYLIRAEANARLNGNINDIKKDLNDIRHRAGLEDISANSIDDLLSAIEKERRVELAFEGHRWFDLVRTDRAIDILPKVTQKYQYLFPIPQSELLANTNPGMVQNPGY